MITLFLQSFISFLSALAGAGLLFKIKLNHNRLCFLISLSAGSLTGAAFLTLIPHAYAYLNIAELITAILAGYLTFWVVNKYFFHICPACSASHFDEQTTKKFSEISMLLFTALAFHSFLDGVALVSEKGAGSHSVFSAIFAHKFPEGLALASLLAGAGYTKRKIFEFVLLVESATLAGSGIGYFFMPSLSLYALSLIQAHLSGTFLFLAFHALIGEIYKNHKRMVIASFISGFLLIFLISIFLH